VVCRQRGGRLGRAALVVALGLGAGAVGALLEAGPAAAQSASRRAWLGVELDGAPGGGVLAKHVIAVSPAGKAGIADGDVLLAADGAALDEPKQLVARVALVGPGGTIALRVRRGGAQRDVSVTLGTFPGAEQLLRIDKVGTFAPSWGTLSPVAGSVPPTLAGLRGRVVVLDFWASWCGPCRLVAPHLSRWQTAYGARGLAVVGVTSDPVPVAYRTAQALDMRYAVVSDAGDQTATRYGVRALPTLFVIDKRGVIREVVTGYEPSRQAELERLVQELLAEPAPEP
jgi:thiol-disulfide isomerase/thioredoxin